jgi:hypothetical protein
MTSAFEYLSVLVSIIVGLALAHLLSSMARLLQLRRRLRLHATTLCWMAFLLLANIQIWWVGFERRDNAAWNFFAFVLYLLMPITGFLLSYLIVPDLDDADGIDLQRNFDDNRPWFFALLAALPAISLAEETLNSGRFPADLDALFRITLVVTAAVAALVRNARFHLVCAALLLAALCAYILLLFLRLQ